MGNDAFVNAITEALNSNFIVPTKIERIEEVIGTLPFRPFAGTIIGEIRSLITNRRVHPEAVNDLLRSAAFAVIAEVTEYRK